MLPSPSIADPAAADLADIHSAALKPQAPDDASPWQWTNRFHALGLRFFTELPAQALPRPHWMAASRSCAELLGLPQDWQERTDWQALQVFSGNTTWPGMRPLASVYSGHQFGQWAGQLGDGRALWLGEIATPSGPQEIQLKGSGLTPYSRMGDGRAVLRSSIREFLCSEAMHALGIPTTRALCLTGSPLPVRRETIETAAVCTRVATSFLRFGHFEHFALHDFGDDDAALCTLADFCIDAYYPACRDAANPYAALLEAVTQRTAVLLAHWQAVGFCHGVMNTDNMSMLGLTLDYGPFGFLDAFDPGHVCNHSDTQGRYAYARQPNIAFWNLHALAQALMPLIGDPDAALAALAPYRRLFPEALLTLMRAKLGFVQSEDGDQALLDDWLRLLAQDRVDYSIAWRRLSDFPVFPAGASLRALFKDHAAFDAWAQRYGARLQREASIDAQRQTRMRRVNPKFVLRNHLAELAIRQAQNGDFHEVQRLLRVLEQPFDEEVAGLSEAEVAVYAAAPPAWAQSIEVSCSS